MKNIIFQALIVCLTLAACSKNQDLSIDSNKNGKVIIKFDPIVNGKKLELNQSTHSNSSGETFTIDKAKFYISNIKLTNNKNEVVQVEKSKSYFLIDVANSESLFPAVEVPEGEYQSLEFNLGIDSLTNTLPVAERTGVLDIANNDMYWSWNSGYIFFKLEGSSNQATSADKKFRYHIGLYGGYNSPTVNNNKIIKIDLRTAGVAKVQQDLSADIHLMADFGKVFDGDNKISIAQYPTVMTSGPHQLIANNYAKMFTHDHTHNFQKH